MYFKNLVVLCCAFSITTGIAFAVDPNPPAVISPTSASAPTGIAPNGIAASGSRVFFTQPFTDGSMSQPRGAYTITVPGGAVSTVSTIPAGNPPPLMGVESSITVVSSPAGSGFTPGDIYTTGVSNSGACGAGTFDAVYKNGSSTPFIDCLVSTNSKHQIDVRFDTVGSFNGAMIVTDDSNIALYNSTTTMLASYTGPSGFVLQASAVAPLSYVTPGMNGACPGCIFVTAMPAGNIDNAAPVCCGEILTVSPGAANLSAAVLFATTTGLPEPESINFVTPESLSCTVGGFTLFASGYATGSQINSPLSTSGAILAWTPAQLKSAGAVGHFLVEDEEFTGSMPGGIFIDGQLSRLFSDTTGTGNSGYQLEDTAIVRCPACELPPITYNVHENGTVGEIAWFNSHLTGLKGTIPTSIFQITITGGKITFGPSTLSVPDAVITFSPTATCAQTTFNVVFNRWETTLPLSAAGHADEIFAAGVAYLIPSGFPQNVNNVTWTANINSSAPGLQVTWQFGVSNWFTSHNGTSFPTLSNTPFVPDYNGMMIDPGHNVTTCGNFGGDHAGSPEFAGRQNVLTGGGSGGGGSNWTGSWSSTPPTVSVCQQQ